MALDKGIIKFGSIITDLSDVYDQDAVQLFRDAIERRGANVDVLGIINDTTSTQVYGMYLKPGTQMAYVLGSGMNTCYTERVDRIEKIDPIKTFGKNVEKVIINLENGMLGDNGSIDFAKTKFDFELDEQSMFPHSYG